MNKLLGILFVFICVNVVNAGYDDRFALQGGIEAMPLCVKKVSETLFISYDAADENKYFNVVPLNKKSAINMNTYTFKHKCTIHDKECNAYAVYKEDGENMYIIYKGSVDFRKGLVQMYLIK